MDKVDRQRADAEDEARRGRDKVRKLTEARSIELAMEEGRRLGYEEGMRQGRLMMQARNNDINRPARYYRRTSFRSARDDDDDQVSYFSYTQEERHSTESSRSSTNHSTSVRCVFFSPIPFFCFIQFSSCSRNRRTSDVRHSPPKQPILTSTSRNFKQVPSLKPDNDINYPEDIAVRPHSTQESSSAIPIRPISTVSRRSSKLPPDGYIPVVGVDSVISLPPPHELSVPVPPAGTSKLSGVATDSSLKQETKQTSTSRSSVQTDHEGRKRTPESVDGDSTLSRQVRTRPGSRSKYSGVPTFIYESTLLDPPDLDGMRRKENKEIDNFTEGARRTGTMSRASVPSERMASKMRCVNPDTMLPLSPLPPQSAFLDGYNASTSRIHGNFIIEVSGVLLIITPFVAFWFFIRRPSLFLPGLTLFIIQRPSSTDPTQRSQSRPSRRPREIVLPTPLPGVFLNPNYATQETIDQRKNENDGVLSSPGARPQFVHRSVSNITVPGIEIVTPVSKCILHVIILLKCSLVVSHFVNSFSKNSYRSSPSYTRERQINTSSCSTSTHHRSTSSSKSRSLPQSTIFQAHPRRRTPHNHGSSR